MVAPKKAPEVVETESPVAEAPEVEQAPATPIPVFTREADVPDPAPRYYAAAGRFHGTLSDIDGNEVDVALPLIIPRAIFKTIPDEATYAETLLHAHAARVGFVETFEGSDHAESNVYALKYVQAYTERQNALLGE